MASNPFRSLTRTQLLGLCLWGEGRSETVLGRLAIAHVILNRAEKRGLSIPDIILQPLQFSCFTPKGGEANYKAVVARAKDTSYDDPLWRECLWLADGAIRGMTVDPTLGADHYVTNVLYMSAKCPAWAKQMRTTALIDAHRFLRA